MSHLTANISPGASIALSPDGQTLVVGGQSGVVELWNISDPSRPKRLGEIKNKNMSWALSLAFARDNHTLAVGAGGDRIPGAASTFPVNLWRTS
jgi:WD40 repeat protein